MATKSFLRNKKDITKNIGNTLIQGGVRGAGTVGAAYITNKLLKPDPTKDKPFIDPKYMGAVMFGLGTIGDAVIANEYGRSFSQGVQGYGALHMAGNLFLEKSKSDFGLAGIDGSDGMGASDKPAFNYSDLADRRWNEVVNGLEGFDDIPEPENINGYDYSEMSGMDDEDLDGANYL